MGKKSKRKSNNQRSQRTMNSRTSSSTARSSASSSSSTAQEPAAQLASMRSRWEQLAGEVALASLFDRLTDITSDIDKLDNDIGDLRARGYRFGRTWEADVEKIRERWPRQRSEAKRMLEEQKRVLKQSAREVEQLLDRAERNHSLIDTVDDRLDALDDNVDEAEQRVRGIYDQTEEGMSELKVEMNKARFLLDSLDDASFQLMPDEHGVAACKAQWVSDQQEPEGLLFLTDSRLIFEQREEKATKKVLFITTQKEKIQETLWDCPIGAVEEMDTEDQKSGLLGLGRKQMLTLRFTERTRELPSDATLQLKGGAENDTWRTLIRNTKSGQIDTDRFGAAAPQKKLAEETQAEAEAPPTELPTQCPNCNATLPQIYKGMKQVACEYCGTTVNI